jgi:hypothetical protein
MTESPERRTTPGFETTQYSRENGSLIRTQKFQIRSSVKRSSITLSSSSVSGIS